MKFCKKCGSQVPAGGVCACGAAAQPPAPGRAAVPPPAPPGRAAAPQPLPPRAPAPMRPGPPPVSHMPQPQPMAAPARPQYAHGGGSSFLDLLDGLRAHMGISGIETNTANPYEHGMLIVPDAVMPNEGEIPVRQYNIATLYNPFATAQGRLQITNKRILFRACGSSLFGRTLQHNEFAIDEIGGFESQHMSVFNKQMFMVNIGLAALFAVVGFGIIFALTGGLDPWGDGGASAADWIVTLLLGFGGMVPFFVLPKKFFLKLACLGIGLGSFAGGFEATEGTFLLVLALPAAALVILCAFLRSTIPQLLICIKHKAGNPAVDMEGFAQVEPTVETDAAIRELGAIITDIQKLGDHGVNKWL